MCYPKYTIAVQKAFTKKKKQERSNLAPTQNRAKELFDTAMHIIVYVKS